MKPKPTKPQPGNTREDETAHEPAAPQTAETEQQWGWLRPEEVEPSGAARFDEANFDNARWMP